MVAISQMEKIRKLVDRLVSSLSGDELFTVPDGFANHIAWNVGHIIVTQQILQYKLSGLEPHVPEYLIEAYKKGTSAATTDPESYQAVLEFLHKEPALLLQDYEGGAFTTFNTYETSTGIVLHNIEEAILFNNIHEGIHLGYMMAMKKQFR